ncbi:hypothetical protein VP01_5102g1, partial [Puccinia sorghi]
WKASKEKEKTNYFMSLLTLWIKSGDQKSRIILDSGALAHIFNDRRFFEHLEEGEFNVIKTVKQDATFPIKGKGTVRLTWGKSSITLDNCLFVPDIVINLISAGKLDSKGCILHSARSRFTVSKNGKPDLKGSINNGLYSVNNPSSIGPDKLPLINMTSPKESLQEIHEKYGHASIQRIGTLLDDSFSSTERDSFECKSCVLAKITKQPFNAESAIANKPFERIHLDLIGPIKPESSLKHQFILTVVDNHSGYLAGFPLVHKDDTTDILINLLKTEQMRRGYFPSLICSDGGGEFMGNRLVSRAERANRTIIESMRATLTCSKIPKRFWHKILKSCCLSLNQIQKRGQLSTPWEVIHGKSFPKNLLRPIGTPAIIFNLTRSKGRKFNPKGEEGRLIGFNVSLQSFRLVTQSGRVVETKHVRFLKMETSNLNLELDDNLLVGVESQSEEIPPTANPAPPLDHRENNDVDQEGSGTSLEEDSVSNSDIENQLTQRDPMPQPQPPTTTRTLRDRSLLKPPTRYGFHHYYEPNTFESAIRCNDAKHWKQAIEKE